MWRSNTSASTRSCFWCSNDKPRLIEALLNFFPDYGLQAIENMILNVMAHWGVQVDESIDFNKLCYRADMAIADEKKRQAAADKANLKAGRR